MYFSIIALVLRSYPLRKKKNNKKKKIKTRLTPMMANENGFQKSILIPVTRYQQLLQYQNKTNESPQTEQKSTQCEPALSMTGQHSDNVLLSSSGPTSSDKGTDDTGIEQKLLNTIYNSFSKGMREKISRLFLFIIHYGRHWISFNEAGNVLVQGRIINRNSNILDLLRGPVLVPLVTLKRLDTRHLFKPCEK